MIKNMHEDIGQYLHAYSLSFYDPCSKQVRKFIADYPKEYEFLIDRMRD